MIEANTVILIGVFAYFAIGALYGGSLLFTTLAFGGKFEPMSIALFFAWPLVILLHAGWLMFVIGGIAAAAGMTWLVSLLLR